MLLVSFEPIFTVSREILSQALTDASFVLALRFGRHANEDAASFL